MASYLEELAVGLERALSIAREARSRGIDPSLQVEIPVASDLAERVEALLGISGIASRIRELEGEFSREEVALRIGDDFVARRFGERSVEEVLDHAIRTAMAILTEGVVAAPTEGIAKVALGRNDDGTQYLRIFYAGPIRSAGGTAQALSVLVGDYVRTTLGLARYHPREEEVSRYVEEIRQYNSIVNLQYLPSNDEIRLIVRECPVCIDGEGTEKEEVSGHRDLERVGTNAVRGGMALVIAEGLVLKAAKVRKHVTKLGLPGWGWLDAIGGGSVQSSSDDEAGGLRPRDKYLRDIIAGRPVFAYPMRKGGFRLRYGRSRNTGLATAGINPATMHILGDFLAVGTQMKIERPGKAAGIVPVDTIEGPTVRLMNGDVIRIDDAATARALAPEVAEILDVGEILIGFGEFLENNHVLIPPTYCEEWWLLEGGKFKPETEEEAIRSALVGAPLHPSYTCFWEDLTCDQICKLADAIAASGVLRDGALTLQMTAAVKTSLEDALIPHRVRDGQIIFSEYRVLLACLGLDDSLQKKSAWGDAPEGDPLALVTHLSGMQVRPRGGTRIGGRMGRPGKSSPREMKPPPHALFPLGDTGGSRRSFQEASTHAPEANMSGGVIKVTTGRRRCPSCGSETYQNICACGTHTNPVFSCPRCHREVSGAICPGCATSAESSQKTTINVREVFSRAIQDLGIRENAVQLVKGVKGLISKEKACEDIRKGILRAKHKVFVFKDGTVRYDMIDLPLTHVRPMETGVTVARLHQLGYTHDLHGLALTKEAQVFEMHPQDLLVSEICGDFLVHVACFIDELLEKCYGLPPFYRAKSRDDLVGQLLIGLAPHTSAGVLGRLIGFSKANVGYAHPYFHAAKRRNCFFGDTKIGVLDHLGWRDVPIRRLVMEQFDISRPGIDRLGTYYSDPQRPVMVRTIDPNGTPHIRRVTSVSVHRAPPTLILLTTSRGKVLVVTPDHAMLVWDTSYLRKVRALEVHEGDGVPSMEGSLVISDRIVSRSIIPSPEDRVYCLTVNEEHTVLANGVFTGQCDGDEDCVMLLLDGLLNFSRAFLPETRGGTMDAPLVLTTRLDPKEIDKESHNIDTGAGYPLELYLAALRYAHPREVEALIDRVEKRLGTSAQLEGFSFTHDTSNISAGPRESMYTQLSSMADKMEAQLKLAVKIRAVDADDVAERILSTHFLPDLMGNLNAFARQRFRCTKCGTNYRRVPLGGKCSRCGGGVVGTVHEASVKKYLQISRDICAQYTISPYTSQRLHLLELAIHATFGEEKSHQLGLADFM
jgi:DNA polymerase II large subunit